jgi:hypothetical protein
VLLSHYAASIGHQIASGLAAAHAAGHAHDLLHPGNVWLGVDDRKKIDRVLVGGFTDGWVRQAVRQDPAAFAEFDAALTRERSYAGWQLDPRAADRVALGHVLAEMLTGKDPQARGKGKGVMDVLARPWAVFGGDGELPKGLKPIIDALVNPTAPATDRDLDDAARRLRAFAVAL